MRPLTFFLMVWILLALTYLGFTYAVILSSSGSERMSLQTLTLFALMSPVFETTTALLVSALACCRCLQGKPFKFFSVFPFTLILVNCAWASFGIYLAFFNYHLLLHNSLTIISLSHILASTLYFYVLLLFLAAALFRFCIRSYSYLRSLILSVLLSLSLPPSILSLVVLFAPPFSKIGLVAVASTLASFLPHLILLCVQPRRCGVLILLLLSRYLPSFSALAFLLSLLTFSQHLALLPTSLSAVLIYFLILNAFTFEAGALLFPYPLPPRSLNYF